MLRKVGGLRQAQRLGVAAPGSSSDRRRLWCPAPLHAADADFRYLPTVLDKLDRVRLVRRTPDSLQPLDTFPRRHIGPDEKDTEEMLRVLDPPAASLDEFVTQVVPPSVLSSRPLRIGADTEREVTGVARAVAGANQGKASYIGMGYYETFTPPVIQRNMLENPAWYTSYTPYQAEISQGRLEGLLNFQTMVSDLTSLPVANASLLDEGTAAAEAMTLSLHTLLSSRAKAQDKVFVVSDRMHPQTIAVLLGRARGLGLRIVSMEVSDKILGAIESLGQRLVGVMVQYPDTYGQVHDFRRLADAVHKQGALVSCATDLLALTLLTPPGEWGADVAFGSAQRFGVPMGAGGPHAAFFAVAEKHKRKMPGRLVGISRDRLGKRALRLALQTREQHIRREKATSNVCTAQALLANMAAMYAVYHGPAGLKAIAERVNRFARIMQTALEDLGFETWRADDGGKVLFDTVVVKAPSCPDVMFDGRGKVAGFLRGVDKDHVAINMGEIIDFHRLGALYAHFERLAKAHGRKSDRNLQSVAEAYVHDPFPDLFRRTSPYLTHPVFNTHHSETELLRYMHHLQAKDLSLVHSMIPLGSCTMKLNATTQMQLVSMTGFANLHPYAPRGSKRGYEALSWALQLQLAEVTGMDAVSLQPNSGAQGEFAGLRAIRQYLNQAGEAARDICLIPVSAHGTNPASAAMAGMRVVPIKCDAKTGDLDLDDLRAKCDQHRAAIAAIMITYPSTFGVFEPHVKEACELVHEAGGLVYMDGANMNAQIGLCAPGEIGADVCHLNLHKTFCIPHGGGGPGVGPICVKKCLEAYLPSQDMHSTCSDQIINANLVSSAPLGSASILPISWSYIALMGGEGLRRATQLAILSANYLMARLRPHYKILYTNEHGRCAHEFILDARPFHDAAGIEAIDIAKRLQDYGFHAPTMSWPVPNTLMIEPTESESREELDRFVDALVAIRQEIRDVEEGRQPRDGNVLKMAPHPIQDIIDGDGDGGAKWERPYTRDKAAYPLPWLREKKFWPSTARVDDAYGDTNLFCTCPPVEYTTSGHISSIQED